MCVNSPRIRVTSKLQKKALRLFCDQLCRSPYSKFSFKIIVTKAKIKITIRISRVHNWKGSLRYQTHELRLMYSRCSYMHSCDIVSFRLFALGVAHPILATTLQHRALSVCEEHLYPCSFRTRSGPYVAKVQM